MEHTVRSPGAAPATMVVAAMVLAGTNVVIGKAIAGRASVFSIGLMSLLFALGAMLPVQLLRIKELLTLTRRDISYMVLQALFGIVLFRVFTLIGLRLTSATEAGIILSTTPGVMTLYAFLFLRERPSARQTVSVGLAVLAVAALTVLAGSARSRGSAGAAFPERMVGNLLVFGAVMGESCLTLFRKKSGGSVSSVTNTTVLVLISLIFFAAAAGLQGFSLPRLDRRLLAGLLAYGVLGTSIAYMLWGHGSVRLPTSTTAVAMSAIPITAILLGHFLLGEKVSWVHAVGASMGVVSIWLGTKQ